MNEMVIARREWLPRSDAAKLASGLAIIDHLCRKRVFHLSGLSPDCPSIGDRDYRHLIRHLLTPSIKLVAVRPRNLGIHLERAESPRRTAVRPPTLTF